MIFLRLTYHVSVDFQERCRIVLKVDVPTVFEWSAASINKECPKAGVDLTDKGSVIFSDTPFKNFNYFCEKLKVIPAVWVRIKRNKVAKN